MFNTSPVLVDVNDKVPAIEALPVPEKALIVGLVNVLLVKVCVASFKVIFDVLDKSV